MRLNVLKNLAAIVCAAALVPALAVRGAFLAGDTNAVVHGSANYTRVFGAVSFNANVDYAVYKPGQFNVSFPGQDPTNNSEYVYAYQIINNGGGTNPQPINFLSVGFLYPESAPTFFPAIGTGTVPDTTNVIPSNGPSSYTSAVNWLFNSPTIPVGSNSAILLYGSPMPPSTASGAVSGTGVPGQNGTLPSPIPEPTVTMLLGIVALLGMGRRSR